MEDRIGSKRSRKRTFCTATRLFYQSVSCLLEKQRDLKRSTLDVQTALGHGPKNDTDTTLDNLTTLPNSVNVVEFAKVSAAHS